MDWPILLVEICSVHQNSLELIQFEELVLLISSVMPSRKAARKLKSVEGETELWPTRGK